AKLRQEEEEKRERKEKIGESKAGPISVLKALIKAAEKK
ncbi:MAG: hypothetical protein XD44_1228, partial [Methanobacteriaceae archaeon 41_258]